MRTQATTIRPRQLPAQRAASAAGWAVLLLALTVAVPWALVVFAPIQAPGAGDLRSLAGDWLSDPRHETRQAISGIGRLLQQPITDRLMIQILAIAVWLIWAAFILCLLAEAASLVAGVPAPHLPALGSMQAATSWLLTGALAGLLASSTLTPQPQAALASPQTTPAAATTLMSSTAASTDDVTLTSAHSEAAAAHGRSVYLVEPGDWLGAIAHRFLGDYNAYDRLQSQNRQLIPATAGPHGPDHIQPGWRLLLPADARDRGPELHATGTTLIHHDTTTGTDQAGTAPAGPKASTPSADGASPSPASSIPLSSNKNEQPSAPSLPADHHGEGPDRTGHHTGIQVGDGWMSWPLAASLAGVAGLVWLARRRRYRYTEPFTYPVVPEAPDDPAGHSPGHDEDPFASDDDLAPSSEQTGDASASGSRRLQRRHGRHSATALHGTGDDYDDSDDDDLRPMPAVLNRIRMLVRAHGDELAAQLPPAPAPVRPAPAANGSAQALAQPHRPDLPDLNGAAELPGPPSSPEADRDYRIPPAGPSGAELAGLHSIPPEGIGLTGPGADNAARALLVAALTAGGPADPDAAGTVVTTFDTLNRLIGGPTAVSLDALPRLQITPDLDAALSVLDEFILERRRTLDEHDETDLSRLREQQPWSPPMPPVLLLAQAPPPTATAIRARVSTSLHLGAPLNVSAAMLGSWERGQTLDLNTSGHVACSSGSAASQLPLLNLADAADLLGALFEAQTGEPASRASEEPAQPAENPRGPAFGQINDSHQDFLEPETNGVSESLEAPGHDAWDESATSVEPDGDTAPGVDSLESPPSRHPVIRPAGERIQVRVLGTPGVLDRDGEPIRSLRSGAGQLLAILAVHRRGQALPDIMEKMWPDTQVRKAADRLSTEVANLRRSVRIGLGRPEDRAETTNAVINTGGFYVLNENLIDVDLWRLQDLVNAAKNTDDPMARISLLRNAIAIHTGPLAGRRDYPWADVTRQQIQRHGIRARLHLAQLIADTDPAQAAQIISAAADLDPVSEDLAQRAIRASAAAGDADAVRARLRVLRKALDEIDQEPTGETLALVANISIAKPPPAGSRLPSHGWPTGSSDE